MMSTAVQLIVTLVMTAFPPSPNGQWEQCTPFSPEPRTVDVATFVSLLPVVIRMEVTDPSCPGAADGSIKVLGALASSGGVVFGIEAIASSGLGYTIQDDTFVNLKAGTYRIIFQFPGNKFRSVEVHLLDKPAPRLYVKKLGHETCDGMLDGFVELDYSPKIPGEFDVYWEDIEELSFTRTNLSAGVYPLSYLVGGAFEACCQDGNVVIGSMDCIRNPLQWSFANGIPAGSFTTPGNVLVQEDGFAQFTGDGVVTIPLDQILQAVVVVKLLFNGTGSIRAFDTNFQTIAEKDLNGEGEWLFVFNTVASHFYIEISGTGGTRLSDLCVFNMDQAPDPIESRLIGVNSSSNRAIAQDVCIGDTVLPYTGFGIQGGITPYTFDWDTDNNGVFDNADSLNTPIIFNEPGMHTVSLVIGDVLGQSDTLHFDYNVLPAEPILFDIENLEIVASSFEVLTLCASQSPFTIDLVQGDGVLTSSSTGLIGNVFDPAMAGQGSHYISINGDACSDGAGIFITVLDEPNASFDPIDDLFLCTDPVVLSTLGVGDSSGLWLLQYDTLVLPIFNDTLDPGVLLTDVTYTLSHVIGEHLCSDSMSTDFTVLPSPRVELDTLAIVLTNESDEFDLNTLLGGSSPGGMWSGGGYIVGTTFDPTGLEPGMYPAIYTVGSGSCLVQDTVFIEIEQISSTNFAELTTSFDLYPNPTSRHFKVCSRAGLADFDIELYDISGRYVPSNSARVGTCQTVDVTTLESGMYIVKVTSFRSEEVYVGKVLVD